MEKIDSKPVVMVFHVEANPDRLPEFYALMKMDLTETRKEEGNLRFDFLKESENKFTVYESWVN